MTPAEIDDLVVRVYRRRLNDACPGDADRMVEKDDDGGKAQRARSDFYRPMVMAVLLETGLHAHKPPPNKKGTGK